MSGVRIKHMVAIWIVATLAGCDQSDPPDNSDTAVPDDYYPLVDGATWTYSHTSKGGWRETVTMRRSKDEDTFIISDTPNPDGESSESSLGTDGTSVYRLDKTVYQEGEPQFSAVYSPGFLRFDASWLDKEIGYVDTRKYKRTETDVGESPKDPRDREHTFVVQSKNEKITVAGETFRNCVRVKREKESVLDETGSIQSDEQEKLFWFAPYVGKIREENLTTGNYEELVEYEVPSS